MLVHLIRLAGALAAGPLWRSLAALPILLVFAAEAQAHPHVWVIVKSDVVFAPDGNATEVRHHWTFDEMFSTFAVQGMDSKKAGGLTREDLAPLAETNVTSLKEFDFFTFAKFDGKRAGFSEPKDYWLEQKDGALTLHFTLPLKKPVPAKKLSFEIYDNSFFVDFSLFQKDPVKLVGAPATCKVAASGPRDGQAAPQPPVDESFFEGMAAGNNYGSQFANRIAITCE